jgi:hypothetical protein
MTVGPEAVAATKNGDCEISLTDTKPVPRAWFLPLSEADVLCLTGLTPEERE